MNKKITESITIKRFKKFIRFLILFFLLVIFIRAFFLGAFQVPTPSMADTLLPGDFIIVNLAAYKITTPATIPIVGIPFYSINLFNTGTPGLNDLVLINFPDSYSGEFSNSGTNIIKRIVAGPVDTLQITGKKIFVNSVELKLPLTIKRSFDQIKPSGAEDNEIFYEASGWNSDNYGPLIVPSRGDTIQITADNIRVWKHLIVHEYKEKVVREEGSVITINGKPVREYVIKKEHYFVIGDNFNNSRDSRYFGFINEDMIVGNVMFIYWSMSPENNNSLISRIRWERIFKGF